MKFLVIGSNSFSGSHFVKTLLLNNFQVFGVSRSAEIIEPFNPYLQYVQKNNFSFKKIDINKNMDDLKKLIQTSRPNFIVNFAAQSMVGQSWDHPEHWYKTNVYNFSKLISLISNSSLDVKYIHVSTPEVYGNTEGWVKENTKFEPSTPYAISRTAGDLHILNFIKYKNFPAVITRAANVYGPGQQMYRIVPRAILSSLSNKKIILDGGGTSVRSFIYIDDVCDATLKICLEAEVGETYHISTREILSIKQLVEKIFLLAGGDFESNVSLGEERLGKDQGYLLESSKIRYNLRWQDNITLDTGLQKTIEWVKSNLDYLLTYPSEYQHKD